MPTRLLMSLVLAGSLTGCSALVAAHVAAQVDDIVSQLKMKIGKIEPKLRMELPLDGSSLEGNVRLIIENPTDKEINASQFYGELSLEQGGNSQPLGAIAFNDPIVIPPESTGSVLVHFNFKYSEIKGVWRQLLAMSIGEPTTWRVTGNLSLIAGGKTYTTPVDLSKTTDLSKPAEKTE